MYLPLGYPPTSACLVAFSLSASLSSCVNTSTSSLQQISPLLSKSNWSKIALISFSDIAMMMVSIVVTAHKEWTVNIWSDEVWILSICQNTENEVYLLTNPADHCRLMSTWKINDAHISLYIGVILKFLFHRLAYLPVLL